MKSYLKDINDIEESARSVQKLMKERYDCGGSSQNPHPICTIAGADAAYGEGYGIGVVVLYAYPSLTIIGHGYAKRAVQFPYIPGLFAFRELPLIIAAYEKIGLVPDLLMVEGHGYAHPQRYGYACQAGAILGIPTIGIAKRPMRGDMEKHPGNERAMHQEILMGGEVTGMALRTRKGSPPVYVSAGYQTTLHFACRMVLETTRMHHLPEPVWAADLLSRKYLNLL
ncbi:MAG: endonuclease V [Burkholderiaceae bacterium]|nr:endonuclease V [Burkholderiaceae bacterium]